VRRVQYDRQELLARVGDAVPLPSLLLIIGERLGCEPTCGRLP
jgi:archaellum biogenesis ATPase FlaH